MESGEKHKNAFKVVEITLEGQIITNFLHFISIFWMFALSQSQTQIFLLTTITEIHQALPDLTLPIEKDLMQYQ